jgi:beta-glucosidase
MLRRSFLAGAAGLALDTLARSESGATDDSGLFRSFGPDFRWGVSTSAYQIEGAVNVDGRGDSIWDVFARIKGNIRNGDTATVAADYYRRYPQDIELIARGGFGNYRFSTAWPRIIPAGTGPINPQGLDFYDRVVDTCAAHGITPWVCLYHWDLPQALQERGGWLNRDIAHWFVDYATAVTRRLGDRVKHWAMFNEAAVHAMIGYGFGDHAPGVRGRSNYVAAMHHQNLAQGLAIQALRAERNDFTLGTVMCLEPVRSVTQSEADIRAAAYFKAFWVEASIDPLFKGKYPELLADEFAAVIGPGDMSNIRQPVDYLGLNYYNELHIKYDGNSPFGLTFGPPPEGSILTAMRWPVEPEGLYRQLIDLRDNYGNPPIYIAENGAAFDDRPGADGIVRDPERIDYFRVHFLAAQRAVRDGAALRGYFIWSLLDNFEWTEGMTKRFGIVHVDFKTLKRTPKQSYAWLSNGLHSRAMAKRGQ